MTDSPIVVSIACTVYNQEPYIKDCLDGFISQQTDFRFEAIVHDDASTDGSVAIIQKYAQKYPEIIKPIFEKENQYSKHDGSLQRIMEKACVGKYIAICEGDDYWIDPLKLQKQVDFMENHPEFSMCCSDSAILFNDKESFWTRYQANQKVPPEDMILGGGQFVQTASLLYRRGLLNNYPDYCRKCHIGDYPKKIWGAINGGLYYFRDRMVVYRFLSIGSWTSQIGNQPIPDLIQRWRSELDMLEGLNEYSEYKYNNAFKRREADFVWESLNEHINDWKIISDNFPDIRILFDRKKRVIDFLMTHHFRWLYFIWKKRNYYLNLNHITSYLKTDSRQKE